MEITIRKKIPQYLAKLKQWLAQTERAPLEEMSAFFSARREEYKRHMSLWTQAYRAFAQLVPLKCGTLLDLGCGTGLELDAIWERSPTLAVTGVDLCQDMLDKLLEKHSDKAIRTICMDYFLYDMGCERWGAVVSFESLHHFLPEQKGSCIKRSIMPSGREAFSSWGITSPAVRRRKRCCAVRICKGENGRRFLRIPLSILIFP